MIWLDKEGHIVMRSNYDHKSVDDIVDTQKAIIYFLQSQDKDFNNKDISYTMLDLLESMLFTPEQVNVKEIKKETV